MLLTSSRSRKFLNVKEVKHLLPLESWLQVLTTGSLTREIGVKRVLEWRKVTEFSTATSTAPSPVSDSVVSSTLPTP